MTSPHWFNKLFNTHAVQDGTPPFAYYSDSFSKADYGVSVRIEEGLAAQTQNIELFITILAGIGMSLLLILGIVIIVNQCRIRKQLRQIQEQLEQNKLGGEV